MAKKYIRFIDSRYNDLFKLEDGGNLLIRNGDGQEVSRCCTYIDDYHTRIGCNVYHICEFAELMERNGNTFRPEKWVDDPELYRRVYLDEGGHQPFRVLDDNGQYGLAYSPDGGDHRFCLFENCFIIDRERFKVFARDLVELTKYPQYRYMNDAKITAILAAWEAAAQEDAPGEDCDDGLEL